MLKFPRCGYNVLVDPIWSERASPVKWAGPRRLNAPAVAFEDLPAIDAVLVTHDHYDHLDTATLQRLWVQHRPRLFAPLGNDAVIREAVPDLEVQTGDWWDFFPLGEDIRLTIVPSYHWSSREVWDRRMALWETLRAAGFSQHADPRDAVQIALAYGAKHLLGVHWGTFPLTDEPWDEPPSLLAEVAAKHSSGDVNFEATRPGDIWTGS